MSDTITAKVFTYNPSVDTEPRYVTYEVPFEPDETTGKMTAMQVLHHIYDNDTTMGYEYSCISGLCGRCSMMIDGKACLACWTCVEPGEHTFEPLAGFPVVRDLKVDKHAVYDRYVATNLANQTVSPVAQIKNIDYDLYWETLERMNMCRECMCCYASCPVLQEQGLWETYAGPGALVQIAQRHLDPHDEADRVGQAVFAGAWNCMQCGACTAVCPSGIDVAGAIKILRDAAEERGMKA